jgi:Ca2+-binding RTX toxin-like protein
MPGPGYERDSMRRLACAGLLVVPLMVWDLGSVTGSAAETLARVPTCRGVPATIVGTPGDDVLHGTSGDDVIVGGRGSDDILGGRGDDLICGGPTQPRTIFGDPVLQYLYGGPGGDTLAGGPGPDEVFGGAGADALIGRSGRDLMGGGDGPDSIRAGSGGDNVNGDGGADQLFGDADGDFIEDATGANTLMGGEGADWISSGRGDETLDGGGDRDVASYTEILNPSGSSGNCRDITVDLSLGTASGTGFGVDGIKHIEEVLTGGGNDVLIGDDGPNGFYAGFPCLTESSPADSVTGNGGVDRVFFTDPFFGESGSGRVSVDLMNHTARLGNQGATPASYTLDSIENVTGTEFRDVILGDAGPNDLDAGPFSSGDVISGRGGDDVLTGRTGGDRLNGGGGADVLLAGGGADHLEGGTGRNRNDGGGGVDTCLRPSRGASAISCERSGLSRTMSGRQDQPAGRGTSNQTN